LNFEFSILLFLNRAVTRFFVLAGSGKAHVFSFILSYLTMEFYGFKVDVGGTLW